MNLKQRVVLVVDDTPDNIHLLNGMLRDKYKVKAATNGGKALKIAQTEPLPDIILLDVMMPEMDGYEVCRRLKADRITANIPVIFITAKTETEDEQQGFAMGAVDYITKPFNPLIVETRIKTQLALSEESRQLRVENKLLNEKIGARFQDITEAGLRGLVAGGETDEVEFKSTLRWNIHTNKADKKIENASLKSVAAFLNSNGGILLVGVDDEGCVLGLQRDRFANEDKLLLHWNSLLNAHLGIEISQMVRSRIYPLADQRLLTVQCLVASKPVFFHRENEETFFVRTGNGTYQLKPSEVIAYLEQKQKTLS